MRRVTHESIALVGFDGVGEGGQELLELGGALLEVGHEEGGRLQLVEEL